MTQQPINTPARFALSTEEFWEEMCRPRFVRLSLHYGAVGSTIMQTDDPPELVPGFMEGKIGEIFRLLGYKPLSSTPSSQD